MKVLVRLVREEEMTIDLCDTEEQFKRITVGQLKEKITEKNCCYGRPGRVTLDYTRDLQKGRIKLQISLGFILGIVVTA